MSRRRDQEAPGKRRSALFLKFLLSYLLLVALILAVISVSLYGVFFRTLKSEIEILASNNLAGMCAFMDTMFYEMDHIAYEVSNDPAMLSHVVYQNRYAALQMSQRLNGYRQTNTFITDILVYYHADIARKYNTGVKFFTTNGILDPVAVFDYFYRFENWSYEALLGEAQTITAPVIRPLESVVTERIDSKEFITYICPIYNSGTPVNERGVVLFLIDRNDLAGMIRGNLREYKGTIGLFDHAGERIFSQSFDEKAQGAAVPVACGDAPVDTPALDTVDVSGEKYTRIMLRSRYNKYAYVLQMPSRLYLDRIYSNMTLFNTTLAVAAFLGLVLAYLLSVQNYRPIRRLVNAIAKYSTRAARERNDLSLLSATFDELVQKNETLAYRIKSQEGIYRLQCLQNLIHGRYSEEAQVAAALKDCGLSFDAVYFAVCIVMIDRSQAIRRDNSSAYMELLKYSIINMLEEIATTKGNAGYGLDTGPDDSVVLILNLKKRSDALDFCGQLTRQLADFFKTNFGYTLTIGVGGCFDSPLSVPLSYRQAGDALSYRFLHGTDRTFVYDAIRRESQRDIQWYPIDQEKQVMSNLMQGDYPNVEAGVNSILGSISMMKLPPDIAHGICFGLVSAIKKALGNMHIQLDDRSVSQLDRLHAMKYDTLWDYQADLLAFMKTVCEAICAAHESKNYRLKEQLDAFVEEHYTDSMLSLETIAAHLGMSPSYLTRYYKNHTGIPLMQHVDNIRMDSARVLLATTHLPLSDVIARTGYVDKSNFIRKFKARFGMTPILYRKTRLNQRLGEQNRAE